MKKLILSVLTLVAFVSISSAQDMQPVSSPKEDASHRAEMQTEKMAQRLSLTKDQKEKIHSINLASAKKMDAVKEKRSAEKAETKKQAAQIQKEKDAQITAVLNEKQKAEYEKMKAEKKQKAQEKHSEHHHESE